MSETTSPSPLQYRLRVYEASKDEPTTRLIARLRDALAAKDAQAGDVYCDIIQGRIERAVAGVKAESLLLS